MIRTSIVLILIMIGQIGYSQKTKGMQKDQFLFEQGLLLQSLVYEDLDLDEKIESSDPKKSDIKAFASSIKETILAKVLTYYQELIDSFPTSKFLYRTLNNKGLIELAINDKIEAIKTFETILNSKADDREKGGSGSGVMAEPYANYKNRAAKILANICLEDSNYTKALAYLDLTKKNPYRHFCGNEYAANNFYMIEMYAKCYIGLHDNKKALTILLPNLLDNSLADNAELVNLTYNTLLNQYSKTELRTLYEAAFKNYRLEKIKNNNGEDEVCSINFLDTKIQVNTWRSFNNLTSEETQKLIEDIYKQSEFYKLLNQ